MQRGGKRRRRDYRRAATGFEKRKFLIPANLVENSCAAIEIKEIGAAAKQNVLAIVDDLSGPRMLIRRSPATEIRTALK
jgi:hypothetical protein